MITNNHPASSIRRNGVSSAEIERAIHFDVEGFLDVEMGSPPLMASVLVDGRTETVVFEGQSSALADAARATGFRTVLLGPWLRDLLDRAVAESRRIAAYSRRERIVFEECGIEGDEIALRYLDTRPLAIAWRRTQHPEVDRAVKARRRRRRERGEFDRGRENSLSALAKLAGIALPPRYGAGLVTARLRAVIGQIDGRGSFEAITPTAKAKWANLVRHNRWDCEASKRLALVAVEAEQNESRR